MDVDAHTTNFRCVHPWIGQRSPSLVAATKHVNRWAWAAAFAAAAVIGALVMWGFTVDDALISIRYARHIAMGEGYRFDVPGPATDGVTPLPWPFLLAPLARGSALDVLVRVKVLDLIMHAGAAALVGWRASRAPMNGRVTALLVFAMCLPLAAYGASGMETPLATLLCTAAIVTPRERVAPLLAGLAAAIRPELLPWAAALACGLSLARGATPSRVMTSVLVSAAPFAACALVRLAAFGHLAPLAILAKPSDLSHGAVYAVAALLASAVPILLIAPLSIRAAPGWTKAVAIAFVVHVMAIAAAGGDSMPYARLFVPVLPSVVLVHLELSSAASRSPLFWLRFATAIALAAFVAVTAAPRGRHVMRDRADLIARARPLLEGASSVAAVDIGWVSAIHEGTIVDLAGLTDPEMAALSGGHTSKHVSGAMLLDRDVDSIVLYSGHLVAERLVTDPVVHSHYHRVAILPLGDGASSYAVYERNAAVK